MPYIEYDKYYTGKLCEMLWHVKDNARVLILVLLLCLYAFLNCTS